MQLISLIYYMKNDGSNGNREEIIEGQIIISLHYIYSMI